LMPDDIVAGVVSAATSLAPASRFGRWWRMLALGCSLALVACATVDLHPVDAREDATHARYAFRLIGMQTLPHRLAFEGTTVGGHECGGAP